MILKNWTPADLLKLCSLNWQAMALQSAVELDFFTALDRLGGRATVSELAGAQSLNSRALDMLATALAAMGLLERAGDEIGLTADSRRYLSKDSADYYGFIIGHWANLTPSWSRLAEAVKSGGPISTEPVAITEDEKRRENFLMGMFNIATQQAQAVAKALNLSGRHRLLDLGGGPGTYALSFVKANAHLTATVFDLPATEKFARATAEKFGLAERVDFVSGHFIDDELPKGYDVAWLSQVLHGEAPQRAARLVANGAEALESGGLMAVQEFIVDDDRRGPLSPALFSLNMLLQTPGGQAYTEGEIKAMLRAAGLKDIQRLKVDLPQGCGIVTGLKA